MSYKNNCNIYELVFIAFFGTLNILFSVIYNGRDIFISIAPLILSITLYFMCFCMKSTHKYSNIQYKKGFYLILINLISLLICSKFISINLGNSLKAALLFQVIVVTILILSSYIFKIKIRHFNWQIQRKSLFIVLSLFIICYLVSNIGNETIIFTKVKTGKDLLLILLNCVFHAIYPGLYEELIFRGLTISALLNLKFKLSNVLIIQSILFGLMHFSSYMIVGGGYYIGLSHQILLGYILGKLYIYTDSISIPVIFHVLYDLF